MDITYASEKKDTTSYQNFTNDSTKIKTHVKYFNILKLTPFKLIGFDNASLEVSLERRHGRNYSTQVMASYILPRNIWETTNFNPKIRGFRVSLEEKFYLMNISKTEPVEIYTGFEFNYLKCKYRGISKFGERISSSDSIYSQNSYLDTIGVRKQTFSFNFKLGCQVTINRLIFDLYAGLGARYKNVSHSDRINLNDDILDQEPPNWDGKYWTLSLPFNAKVGYAF